MDEASAPMSVRVSTASRKNIRSMRSSTDRRAASTSTSTPSGTEVDIAEEVVTSSPIV